VFSYRDWDFDYSIHKELIMAESSVHTELHDRLSTNSFAKLRIPRVLLIGGVLTVALIGATFGTQHSGAIGEAVAPEAFVDLSRRDGVSKVELTKIAPADPLGTSVVWSPLTGDGSN
jgi:hypothetical protein